MGSAALGLAAISIRDPGACAIGAVLLIALAKSVSRGDRRGRRATLAVAAGLAVVGLALLGWAHGLPHAEQITPGLHLSFGYRVPRTILTLALFVSPSLVLVSPRRLALAVRRTSRPLQVVFGVGSVGLLVASTGTFIGDDFTTVPAMQSTHVAVWPP